MYCAFRAVKLADVLLTVAKVRSRHLSIAAYSVSYQCSEWQYGNNKRLLGVQRKATVKNVYNCYGHRNMSSDVQEAAASPSSDGLLISDSCATRLRQVASEYTYLRVIVEGGGCSGFQYKFELDKQTGPNDILFEKDGAKVLVDKESLEYVKGATVDYNTELIRSAFRIQQNPRAEHGCSCGSSFSLKT